MVCDQISVAVQVEGDMRCNGLVWYSFVWCGVACCTGEVCDMVGLYGMLWHGLACCTGGMRYDGLE